MRSELSLLLFCLISQHHARVLRPEDYGARGDGQRNDTAALTATLRQCGVEGGCQLQLTKNYLTAPIVLPSNCEVVLTGKITAGPMSWWGSKPSEIVFGKPAYITNVDSASNITLHGGGSIDGQGAPWWAAVHDDLAFRPHLAVFTAVEDLVLSNVTLINSPNHNVFVEDCHHLRFLNVTVIAPHNSKNTDGLNVAGGSDAVVAHCYISNGHVCISIVPSSRTAPPPGAWPVRLPYGGNVHVHDMHCVGGHGISIGSIKHGIVENVTVEDVVFDGGENGARIKTYPNSTGYVKNIRSVTATGP